MVLGTAISNNFCTKLPIKGAKKLPMHLILVSKTTCLFYNWESAHSVAI
jgi:hypothetical protein